MVEAPPRRRGWPWCLATALLGCGSPTPADLTLAEVQALVGEAAPASPRVEPTPARARIGVVLAGRSVDLRVRFEAQVLELPFVVGQEVREGDIVARLDPRRAAEELEMSRADLEAARARRAELAVSLEDAEREATEATLLQSDGVVSRSTAADAQAERKKLESALRGAVAQLGRAKIRSTQLRRQLEERSLAAPFAGVVVQRYVDPGATVDSRVPVLRLLDRSTTRVRFGVEPTETGRWQAGRFVRVRSADGGRQWRATVTAVMPEVDPTTGEVIVDAEIEMPDDTTLAHGTAVYVDGEHAKDER